MTHPQQPKTPLHIACAVDDSFSYPLAVMLVSLFQNHPEELLRIHLFSASLSDDNVARLQKLAQRYKQELVFYPLQPHLFEGLPTNDRISAASYYRLLIPEVIEADVTKFLYLDADIIVCKSLRPLFEIDMQDKIIAAINDVSAIEMNMHLKHSIPPPFLYFNAGILMVDKLNWLKYEASQKVIRYIAENKDLCQFHDQDGLNATLYNKRLELPPVWNQQIGLYYTDTDVLNRVYNGQHMEALKHPAIVHFNGSEKPWHQVSAHPWKKEFRKYASQALEFSWREPWNWRKQAKRTLIYGLVGWIRVNRYYYQKQQKINQKSNHLKS